MPRKTTVGPIRRIRQPKPPVAVPTAEATKKIEPSPEVKGKYNKRIGIDPETLKPLFTAKEKSDPVKKLVLMINGRIKDGRSLNFSSYRVWAAIDKAYDAPFDQITPTLVSSILRQNLKPDAIIKELSGWGLDESTLFTTTTEVVEGKVVTTKVLNEETFYKTLVPLVKSYITIRLAKLFNDRNQYPFFKFEPFHFTESNRVICEILTDIVSRMSQQYGFPAVLRQGILQALMYSIALIFPKEAWHVEMDQDDKGNEFASKEGLRYNIPHPSRMFWDQSERPSSFNTDTGAEFAGYWRVNKFGDVKDNDLYWNLESIPYGATNYFDPAKSGNYFKELYPCTMVMPVFSDGNSKTREERASIYTTTDNDKAVFVTDLFMKLSPKKWGLGEWKHKVWFRFVVAADDTVIFAEPLPYCPVLYIGYDADENRARNPSMALEIIPWQDHMGNVISQILLSAKQNLAKIVYYDSDQVDEATIRKMETQKRDCSGITFVAYSSMKTKMQGNDPSKLFLPITFPQQDTVQLTSVIGTVISIMERLLGMSSSEVGAAGTHVQTAEEIRVISGNTSTRVDYTGTFVDDAVDAWKRQIYCAMREYMDEEFLAQVSAVSPEAIKELEKIGFKLGETYEGRTHISGKQSMLSISSFASSRDGQQRVNAPQIAQVMMQTIQAIAANPMLAQSVGAEQLLDMLHRSSVLAGAPKDWRLKPDDKAKVQQNLQAMQQQLEGIAKKIEESAVTKSVQIMGKGLKPIVKQIEGQGKAIEKVAEVNDQQSQVDQKIAESIQTLQYLVGALHQSLQPQPPTALDGP